MIRWRALVPLVLLLAGLGAAWYLLLDTLVARGVEVVGERVTGAKVELAGADVRLGEGAVRLRGLQVADPDRPMRNLLEAEEVVADLKVLPLLEKKVVVETLAVRGVRLGTPRATSGALDNPPGESGRLWREVRGWAGQVHVPQLNLEGLKGTVNVAAISPESLVTLAWARSLESAADSMRQAWQASLAQLDPGRTLDSARAVVEQLRTAQPLRLGPVGLANLVRSARATTTSVEALRASVTALDSTVTQGVAGLQTGVQGLAQRRREDYAYARRLLRLPSLDAPEISPALFGQVAVEWMAPVLYWVRLAGEYLPPGLDPRRRPGPERLRRAGTTVQFPGRTEYPRFLVEHADASLEIAGAGVEAGRYAARVEGLTTTPTLYGKPARIAVQRLAATRGPKEIQVSALLDHVRAPIRDSLSARLRHVALPSLGLPALGGRLALGEGDIDLDLARSGDSLAGRWLWHADQVTWERTAAAANTTLEELLWRAASGIRRVEIEVRVSGTVAAPAIGVRSNVGDVVAQSLRQAVGQQVQAAEARVRAQVDSLVGGAVADARDRVGTVTSGVRQEVESRLAEVRQVQEELKAQLQRIRP